MAALTVLDLAAPCEPALRLTRATVEALLDAAVPAHLDDVRTVLLATRRYRPGPAEGELPGELAARLPVLG